MNRIFLTVLMIAFLSARAAGQEADTLARQAGPDAVSVEDEGISPSDSLSPTRHQDFIDSQSDSTPEGYVPMIMPDTVYEIYGQDTVSRYRKGVRVNADTAALEADLKHSPIRAVMYALVLPGLGQGYNRRYYKIPIVFAAIGGAGYAISHTTKQYKFYSREYASNPDDLGERYLRYWRRNMELSYIAMIAVYALQVVDAYVDAQLYNWDVNEELSMGISPSLQPLLAPGSLTGHAYGLTCSFKLKR